MDTVWEIAKYTLPAIVVLIATSIIVSKFLKNKTRERQLEIFEKGLSDSVRLRLQAYERLTLFLERIRPRAILPRVYKNGMTVGAFQRALINTIKQEFEYNLSQQIYVSGQVWSVVTNVKEQEMVIINQIAASIKPGSSAKVLHQRMLEYFMSDDSNKFPLTVGLEMIQNEAKMVMYQKA